jgi:hypothetical protein
VESAQRRAWRHCAAALRGWAFEELEHVGVAALASDVGGGQSARVGQGRVGAVVEQQACQLEMAGLGGLVQRREAILLASIDVGRGGNEELGDARLRASSAA